MRPPGYELLDEIGRGGCGTVWRARSGSGLIVAVKMLYSVSEESRARFAREVRLVGTLGVAEGFVPLLDSGETTEGPFLVMPFLEGGTLRGRLARGPLTAEETISLARSLARALARAHERGIVHRDMKPENVLFTKEGRPLVSDLGLAKHFDRNAPGASESAWFSQAGAVQGTASYMSPEQIDGAASLGPPADVFALGAILSECLTGRRAFAGASVLEIFAKVVGGHRERPAVTSAPAWFLAVVERALAPSAADRFSDAGAMSVALDAEASPGARRVGVAALAGIAALSLGALGLLVVATRSSPPAAPPATVAPAPAAAPSTRTTALAPLDAGAVLERGLERMRRRDLEGALEDLTTVIEAEPGNARAHFSRGQIRDERGELALALEDYTEAVVANPLDAKAWYSRGELRSRRGDEAGALADYSRAIEAEPRLIPAWYNRGELLVRRRDEARAIEDFTKVIALDPKMATAWSNRGWLRDRRGDSVGAVADFTRAIEADPKFALAWNNRGHVRAGRGEPALALDDFERAFALGLPKEVAKVTGERIESLRRQLGRGR